QWITGEQARAHVHELRSQHQGIIVGGETVRKDNPKLTVRLPDYKGSQPWRIIFTKSGDLPCTHHVFTDEWKHQTIVYTEKELKFDFPNVVKIKNLKEAMVDLHARNFVSLMMESGSCLASDFIKEGLIDRISLYQNPSFLGAGKGILGDLNLAALKNRPTLK